MRIAFCDTIAWDYTPLTPFERPLGGIQSALCYLASALAARGHDVALINNAATPGVYGGVECWGNRALTPALLNAFDAIISVSAIGGQLRAIGVTVPLIWWVGHDVDQPFVASLKDVGERDAWTQFAFVSGWQAQRFQNNFSIPADRIALLRYAVSPAFETLAHKRNAYFFNENRAPIFAYTPTPFRGLQELLMAFPSICDAFPGATLRVYSGMRVYQVTAERDDYALLYKLAAAIRNVDYIGPLGQTALAEALRDADVFIYPNTFPETSCISVMEAMMSGCLVMTTANAALPETCAGFAQLFYPQASMGALGFAAAFADWTVKSLRDIQAEPGAARQSIDGQIDFALGQYVWSHRAQEWEGWLSGLIGR